MNVIGTTVYQLGVQLTDEQGGGFSVFASNLPGCASQGDTRGEAMANFQEAASGVIESYLADGKMVPIETEPYKPQLNLIVRVSLMSDVSFQFEFEWRTQTRTDTSGRDVTDLSGLWDESDSTSL